MPKFKVTVERRVEAEDEDEAVERFIAWFYDADNNAEITFMGNEVTVEEIKEEKRPKRLVDIAEMPNFNPSVKDGIHSVSEGKIFWTDNNLVTCKEHGACLAVNKELTIWRCPACNEGAYVEW